MKQESKDQNPALELAKEQHSGGAGTVYNLPNGAKVAILPVSATLLDEVTARITDPEPPMWFNPAKEKDEPNPMDPGHIKALAAADRRRLVASFDVMTMFGLELLDGMPEDESWIRKLQMMERLGHIDLSTYDLKNDLDREFVYKRYIILSADLIGKIGSASGLTDEEVAKAEATFQDNS